MILQLQKYELLNCKIGRRWAFVKGYEDFYQVSDDGLVRSFNRKVRFGNSLVCVFGKMLKLIHHNRTGLCVSLHDGNGKRKMYHVSRLVAQHFIPNPNNKKCVLHIDKDANNNSVNNLKWATISECSKSVTQKKGQDRHGSKLTAKDVMSARIKFKKGDSIGTLSAEYNVSTSTMRKMLLHKTWKHIN
jgi:hypothetical protein